MDPILQTQELSEESVARARLLSSGLVCVIAAGTAREAGMQTQSSLKSLMHTLLISLVLAGFGTTAKAQGLPAYMAPISGHTTSSSAETALKDLLALNTGMFELYDAAAKVFERNILGKHPVILGLFSGAGGRFILYRPGMAPLEAPSVPIVYQLLKSVDHSTMALTQVVGPYLDNPADQSWHGPMLAFRARMKSALERLDLLRRPARILEEAEPLTQAQYRLGGANPSRSLDEGDWGMEDDAWQRLGENLRRQQHHLCGAAE